MKISVIEIHVFDTDLAHFFILSYMRGSVKNYLFFCTKI